MPLVEEYHRRFEHVDQNPLHKKIVDSISWQHGLYSQYSPVKEIVLAVPTGLLWPHELVKEENLADIHFDTGWHGAPIAVAGLFDDHLYDCLESGLYIATHLMTEELRQVMIIDGQTRWTKLQRQGIPTSLVQFFPLAHEELSLSTWRDGFTPLTVEQVRLAAQSKCHVPPKATKFQVLVHGEGAKRIMEVQRQWMVPKDTLTQRIPAYWDQEMGIKG